jgi:RNA polymerase sigma factor (sigma-70 family)
MVINGHYLATLRHIRSLFDAGTQGGHTDRVLLEHLQAGEAAAQAAFAALLERHGPMVWQVCRSTLGNAQDSDDAFQATFLVLVRRAGSLWVRDSLGPWLHGVAIRVARQARVTAARRRVHERRAAEQAITTTSGSFLSAEQEEVAQQLHEELSRLPGRYRAPLILCYLEGLTHEQAAAQLRCPVGTVRSRLARGRERFRTQLIRRGLAPCAGLAGVELLGGPMTALLPPDLVSRTAEAGLWKVAGHHAFPLVSSSVIKLTEGVIQTMFMSKLKATCASALLIALLGTGIGVSARQALPKGADDGERPKFKDYGKSLGDAKKADVYETKSAGYGMGKGYLSRNLAPSVSRPHEILAMPGATIRIRVENPDRSTTECRATVREDGRLAIAEDIVNPSREETSSSQLTVKEVVISSESSEPQPPRRWSRSGLTKDDMAKSPYSVLADSPDHEQRLRSLELKLDRVLEQLRFDSGASRGHPQIEAQKK